MSFKIYGGDTNLIMNSVQNQAEAVIWSPEARKAIRDHVRFEQCIQDQLSSAMRAFKPSL